MNSATTAMKRKRKISRTKVLSSPGWASRRADIVAVLSVRRGGPVCGAVRSGQLDSDSVRSSSIASPSATRTTTCPPRTRRARTIGAGGDHPLLGEPVEPPAVDLYGARGPQRGQGPAVLADEVLQAGPVPDRGRRLDLLGLGRLEHQPAAHRGPRPGRGRRREGRRQGDGDDAEHQQAGLHRVGEGQPDGRTDEDAGREAEQAAGGHEDLGHQQEQAEGERHGGPDQGAAHRFPGIRGHVARPPRGGAGRPHDCSSRLAAVERRGARHGVFVPAQTFLTITRRPGRRRPAPSSPARCRSRRR